MKKITLLSLITFLFINNLVSQIISVKKPDIDKLTVFSCGASKVSDVNNNSYNTIIIGKQCWMQSNLKVSNYRNGAGILTGLSDGAWANTTKGAYAFYANSNANDAIYGKLYNWYAVKDGQLCPTGWHVPSEAEWTTLITYLGGENVAGGKMKSIGTTYWNSPNTGATNVSGFSVLPGGNRYSDGSFDFISYRAFFWTATQIDYNSKFAWGRYLGFNFGNVDRYNNSKSFGASVRCLRD